MKDFMIDRLREPSTWRGMVAAVFAMLNLYDPVVALSLSSALLGVIEAIREEIKKAPSN